MGVVARIWFTPKQKAELWERWRAGQCVSDIARALERRNKSGVRFKASADGMSGLGAPLRTATPMLERATWAALPAAAVPSFRKPIYLGLMARGRVDVR
jgi:hypothetical protein